MDDPNYATQEEREAGVVVGHWQSETLNKIIVALWSVLEMTQECTRAASWQGLAAMWTWGSGSAGPFLVEG